MVVTKRRLTECLYDQCGFRMREAENLVESLMELMKSTLESGEDILISGFGKFCVREKSARRGRNPQTGEDLVLGERRVVTFKPSPVLRRKLDGRG